MTNESSDFAQSPKDVSATEQFYINYHGKKYRVYIAPMSPNWSMRVMKNGKSVWKSLGTPIREVAKKQAKVFLDALFSESWEDRTESLRLKKRPQSTIGDLVECYLRYAPSEIGVQPYVAKQNVNRLLALWMAHGRHDNPRALRVEELSNDLLREFVSESRRMGIADVSIRSSLARARSVVTPKMRGVYDRHLCIPNSLFELNFSFGLNTAGSGFVPFPADVVEAMEDAIKKEEGNVRRGYLLMARLGMRNSEAASARLSWVEILDGRRMIVIKDRPDEGFKVKNSLPGALPIDDELWNQLTRDLRPDAVYFLDASSKTSRKDIVDRDLNRFVRRFFPDRKKGAYELRKWAGSIVATRTQNIYMAQIFLRHKSVKTTESFYATFLGRAPSVTTSDIVAIYAGSAVTL